MATIKIQIDDDTKTAADSLFENYGLNTEAALQVFISTVIKHSGIPFLLEGFSQPINEEIEEIRQKRLAFIGCMEGNVWIADDFDEPLEEMKEYME